MIQPSRYRGHSKHLVRASDQTLEWGYRGKRGGANAAADIRWLLTCLSRVSDELQAGLRAWVADAVSLTAKVGAR